MTVTDTQTGIVQTTNYSTTFPQIGLITLQTKVCPVSVCTGGAVTLNSTANTYETLSLGTGTDGVARKFVALQQSSSISNDLDGTAMPTFMTKYTYDCDTGGSCSGTSPAGFGNAMTVVYCELDGTNCIAGATKKTTTNTYTNDATNWFLGRLLTATVQSIVPNTPTLTRQTSYCYSLSYTPAGTSCSTNSTPDGLLTQEIMEPESSSDPSLKLETDFTYDAFGNKTSAITNGCVWINATTCSTTTSTATRETDTEFSTTSGNHGQFPTKTTNALNQSRPGPMPRPPPQATAFPLPSASPTATLAPMVLSPTGPTTPSAAKPTNTALTRPWTPSRTTIAP